MVRFHGSPNLFKTFTAETKGCEGFGVVLCMLCIGLFGTCDNNRWRDPFMEKYNSLGFSYFNPMVDNWHPGLVAEEAKHLAEDEIILFPILGWSYAEGSLSEVGFGPLKAMRQNVNRSFVFYVEDTLHERLRDPERCKASLRSRELVLGHLRELGLLTSSSVDLSMRCFLRALNCSIFISG